MNEQDKRTNNKFGYLKDLITDDKDLNEARQLIFSMDWADSPLQNVNNINDNYIQSILWLDDLADIWEQMEECGRVDYQDGNEAKKIKALCDTLAKYMNKNDLQFLFI